MPFDGAESPFNYVARFDLVIDLIEAPGRWTKRTYRNKHGQYCLKEALNMIGVAEILEPIILRAAAETADREFCCIESFNDLPGTTHRDVVTVLYRVRDDLINGRIRLPISAAMAPLEIGRSRRFDDVVARLRHPRHHRDL